MNASPTTRAPARPRRRSTRFALVAVLMTLFVSALPGTASAAGIVPMAECYAQNSNGTFTVVLGYNSPYTTTRTISRGWNNYATPSTYTAQLPTVFKPGLQRGAAKLTVSQSDLYAGTVSWYLDGNTLNTWNAGSIPICTSAQLPAYANGGAIVVLLLLAGAVGVLVVRRARRVTTERAGPLAV
ncbi:hypothetical protein [Blastococcus litoris]|uniref:hypothetical protein n=1 Tax=Blastococcus litoris TaxID=2171622 RepID=UPI000E30505D|nr:hypothetical protein [Blastococcus litoris]